MKRIKSTLFTKLNVSIYLTFLFGTLIGGLSIAKITVLDANIIIKDNSSDVVNFLNIFSLNYWPLFLIWILGLLAMGFIITYVIIFGKGYFMGLMWGFLLKTNALFGTIIFIKNALWDLFILVPLTIFISIISIRLSFVKTNQKMVINNYLNFLILITIGCVIYSFITVLLS